MHYSLLSRFQGALVGAALGEIIGFRYQTRLQTHFTQSFKTVEDWEHGSQSTSVIPQAISQASLGKIIVDSSLQLIDQNQWNLNQWSLDEQPNKLELFWTALDIQNASSAPVNLAYIATGMAIATLPLSLYFHEDRHRLQSHLQSILTQADLASVEAELAQAVMISAYIISLALQERLEPHRLISDVFAELALDPTQSAVSQSLQQAQDLIKQGQPLTSIASRIPHGFSSTPDKMVIGSDMLLALCGFLQTPEEFRLSLLRIAPLSPKPRWTCMLAGAFSGAYNGVAGLPLAWRRWLHPPRAGAVLLKELWSLPSEHELLRLATDFLTVWAGSYSFQNVSATASSLSIAAPGIIRP
jgi:ADP-ribosylglycohydrolase